MKLKELIGSGDRIGLLTLPFLVAAVALGLWRPELFTVGGPSATLQAVAIAGSAVGVVAWAWSVVLILTRVPRHELITTGPFALVKHPLYTSVALLVIPCVGLLLDSWLGFVVGAVVYAGTRMFAPAEERALAAEFGREWDAYAKRVVIRWL